MGTRRTAGPIRTCLGCREREPARGLLRLAVDGEGVLCADPEGRRPGRGGWVHRRRICLERALEARVLARAFRGRVRRVPEELGLAVLERGD